MRKTKKSHAHKARKTRRSRDPKNHSRTEARRLFHSGDLKIDVRWVEGPSTRTAPHGGVYHCRISTRGGMGKTMLVNAPHHLTSAVDSAAAMKSAAHAALSFADHEGWPVEEHAEFTDRGYAIHARAHRPGH